jgi:parallel beta-helix repeat protein
MKSRYLVISFTLGLGLVLALLWVLGGRGAPAVLALSADGTSAAEGAAPAVSQVERVAEEPLEAPSAPAAELHVCPSGCAYSSVQAAVDAANDGDVIKVAAGTYTGVSVRPRNDVTTTGVVTQVVYVSKTITIRGGYTTTNWTMSDPEANPTTLDAQGRGRVLYITGDISATVEGLRITGGDATGLGGTWSFEDPGGGIYAITTTVTIKDNQVFSNTASKGGGLFLIYGDGTLSGNTVTGNSANNGGGLLIFSGNATLSGNTVTGNTAWNDGGGLHLYGSAKLSGNTITSNTASAWGGGLYLYSCDATLVNDVVADNQAGNGTNGLAIGGSSVHLLHTTIARNGSNGEGILVANLPTLPPRHSVVTLTNTILVSHAVGILVSSGTVTLNGVLWYNNTDGNTSGWGISVTNEITGTPAFASDGYHITPASAAMDAGIDAGATTDIDGHHRPYNSAPDLGADELIAISIPTDDGRTLVYTDTQGSPTAIRVPAGAVMEPTMLVYTPVETATTPSGFAFAGHAFDLDAYRGGALLPNFVFSLPVTITIHYAEADVTGLDENSLVLEYWNGSAWVDAACGDYNRHPDENWLAVPVCHLSRFALSGEREYLVYLPLGLRNQ